MVVIKLDYFKEQTAQTSQQIILSDKQYNQISTLRLVFFVLSAVCLGSGFLEKSIISFIIGVVFLGVFIYLIKIHNKISTELEYNKNKKEVLYRYESRFTDEWQNFKQTGEEYLTEDSIQANDLDLLGKASLYQYITVAHTPWGKSVLANYFSHTDYDLTKILNKQKAVEELSHKKDFLIHIESLTNSFDTSNTSFNLDDIRNFIKYCEDTEFHQSKFENILAFIMPVATALAIGLSILNITPFYIVYVVLGISILLNVLNYQKAAATLNPLFEFQKNIEKYEKIFESFENEEFNSSYLKELQNLLTKNGGACKGIHKLNPVANAASLRHMPLFHFFGCIFLMSDHHCLQSWVKWKTVYGYHLRSWFTSVGEFEALMSLSVICHVKENYAFPVVTNSETPYFNAADVFHPLIKEDCVISNSLSLNAETCIITGSNMSGKTTFLRSVGVNMFLAYAGGPVCAKSFETAIMTVFTSMRVNDNVSQGISTFYAEILRIRSMVVYSSQQKPMIVLIDEIFKGTNSADRIIGATGTVKKLSEPWIISMITTHDFELCDLAEQKDIKAKNYHFSEYYVNNEIHFDYLIKDGRCQTTNAQHLMRMAGLL